MGTADVQETVLDILKELNKQIDKPVYHYVLAKQVKFKEDSDPLPQVLQCQQEQCTMPKTYIANYGWATSDQNDNMDVSNVAVYLTRIDYDTKLVIDQAGTWDVYMKANDGLFYVSRHNPDLSTSDVNYERKFAWNPSYFRSNKILVFLVNDDISTSSTATLTKYSPVHGADEPTPSDPAMTSAETQIDSETLDPTMLRNSSFSEKTGNPFVGSDPLSSEKMSNPFADSDSVEVNPSENPSANVSVVASDDEILPDVDGPQMQLSHDQTVPSIVTTSEESDSNKRTGGSTRTNIEHSKKRRSKKRRSKKKSRKSRLRATLKNNYIEN